MNTTEWTGVVHSRYSEVRKGPSMKQNKIFGDRQGRCCGFWAQAQTGALESLGKEFMNMIRYTVQTHSIWEGKQLWLNLSWACQGAVPEPFLNARTVGRKEERACSEYVHYCDPSLSPHRQTHTELRAKWGGCKAGLYPPHYHSFYKSGPRYN